MKILKLISVSALGVMLAGCINLPQTKALITPVGAIGVHSFAPPPAPPRGVDFMEPRRLAHDTATESAQGNKPQG